MFPGGGKYKFTLEFDSGGNKIDIPILLARGRQRGKLLGVCAGVHGDEYEGIRAIFEVFSELDPSEMAGDLLAVPVANTPAFWAGTRNSGLDGEDLARCFPGALDAGQTRAIAFHLARTVIARSDFFLDLHSAGTRLLMPTLLGYDATDPRSRAAALDFGAKVLWAHPRVAPGRTISFAKALGVPWAYTEAKGSGRVDPEDLRIYVDGIRNLLRHLSILPGPPVPSHVECHLFGDGDTNNSVCSTRQGFFFPTIGILQRVRSGEDLGRVLDLHGETIEMVYAPSDGIVVMIRQAPAVQTGDALIMLTGCIA
jgi:N2-acetyl-L-2,4-diaminobutanoate deacetylase